MISFPAIWSLFIAIFAIVPMIMLRKRQRTTWWDYVYPFSGVALWFPFLLMSLFLCRWFNVVNVESVLPSSQVAAYSEGYWIAVASIIVPWVRWFLSCRFQKEQIKVLSFVLTFVPILSSIIRVTMLILPG